MKRVLEVMVNEHCSGPGPSVFGSLRDPGGTETRHERGDPNAAHLSGYGASPRPSSGVSLKGQ